MAPRLLLVMALLQLALATAQQQQQQQQKQQQQLRLLFVPLLPTSPSMDAVAVATQLRARGHDVLVVAAEPALPLLRRAAVRHSSNTTAEALRWIGVSLPPAQPPPASGARVGRVTQARFAVPGFWRSFVAGLELQLVIQDVVAEPCGQLLANASLMQALRDFRPHALSAIGVPVPDSAPDSCGCLMSAALSVPMLDIDCGNTFWGGGPSPRVPQFGTGLTPADVSTWPGFLRNLAAWSIKRVVPPLLTALARSPWAAVRERLGLPRTANEWPLLDVAAAARGVRRQRCDVLLNVILASWLLEYPRPLAPHQVLVGPGTPRLPQPIVPAEVKEFMDGAVDGLVLVASGTSWQFNRWLQPADFAELAAAFASLAPTRVLWNLNTQVLPDGLTLEQLQPAANTLLADWVDYNDVLGHPNTRLFLSHCGLHSVYEAMFHGVPVLGLPFMLEQAESCAKLAARGAAVVCRQAPAFRAGTHVHYTRDHVAGLVRQLLANSSSFAAAARGLSAPLQLHARRQHPYARAADAIELAINERAVVVAAARAGSSAADGAGAGAAGHAEL